MLQELENLLSVDESVLFAYVFGSQVSGTPRRDSDLDVAVWLNVPDDGLTDTLLGLAARLSQELGVTVDVVDLNRAQILLRNQVLRKGRIVVDRNRASRVAFESRTLVEGIDFERIRRRCAAGLARRMRREAGRG